MAAALRQAQKMKLLQGKARRKSERGGREREPGKGGVEEAQSKLPYQLTK